MRPLWPCFALALLLAGSLPAVAKRSAPPPPTCDGFAFVCGVVVPFCGCGSVPPVPGRCFKAAKDAGRVVQLGRAYCAPF